MKKVLSHGGTVNADQGGAAQIAFEPVTSRKGLGRSSPHSSDVGAGNKATPGFCLEGLAADPQCRDGSQAGSPGLFGLRIDAATGSAPAPSVVRPASQATHAARQGQLTKASRRPARREHYRDYRPQSQAEQDGHRTQRSTRGWA